MVLLAPRDAAAAIGISISRLVQLDREGAFRALRDSAGRRLYDEAQVRAYAKARERSRAAAGRIRSRQ